MIFGCFWLFSYIFHLKSNELQKYIKFLNNLQPLFFNMYYDKNRDVIYCVHKKNVETQNLASLQTNEL